MVSFNPLGPAGDNDESILDDMNYYTCSLTTAPLSFFLLRFPLYITHSVCSLDRAGELHMPPKPDLASEGKTLGDILSSARKQPHNFAILLGNADVVVKADRRKPVTAMRIAAKSEGGGARGAWGVMTVSAKQIILNCEEEPPGSLVKQIRKHFADRGHKIQVEIRLAQSSQDNDGDEDADDPDMRPKSNSAEPASSSAEWDVQDDPDNEDDLAAASGDISALMRAVRKKAHSFAWLIGKDGMVLKAHRRKPVELMLREAKAEAGSLRGAWGQMNAEGTTLLLKCPEDPAGSFIKNAKTHLRGAGQKFRIVLQSPSGEQVEEIDAETPQTAETAQDDVAKTEVLDGLRVEFVQMQDALSAASALPDSKVSKKIEVMAGMLEASLAAGDSVKSAKLLSAVSAILPPPAAPAAMASAQGGERPQSAAQKPQDADIKDSTATPDTHATLPLETSVDGPKYYGPFRVALSGGPMSNAELTLEAYRQLLSWKLNQSVTPETAQSYISENGISGIVVYDAAKATNIPLTIPADRKEKEIWLALLPVDISQYPADEADDLEAYRNSLDPETKRKIDAETDAAFYSSSQMEPGELIPSPDHQSAQHWLAIRQDIVAKTEFSAKLNDHSRAFFKFGEGGIPLTRDTMERVLVMQEKIKYLSIDQLADFYSRTGGTTDSIATFEASVDQYLKVVAKEEAVTDTRQDSHDELVGLDQLYATYLKSKRPRLAENGGKMDGYEPNEYSIAYNKETAAAKDALAAMLAENGFASAKEFQAKIDAYEIAFRNEAISKANAAMERRVHDLQVFEDDVLTDESVNAMFAATSAARDKLSAIEDDDGWTKYRIGLINSPGPLNMSVVRDDLRPMVLTAIDGDPGLKKLVELRKAEDPDFTIDDDLIDLLTEAQSPADLRGRIMSMLNERRDGINETRNLLEAKPDSVWRFNGAIDGTRAAANAAGGNIQSKILDAHMQSLESKDLGKKLLIGGAAIVAGLFTFGEGTVAVLGAAAALGLGSYDAWDTYVTYAEDNAANLAGISSTDPSFAWVVVALVTLPLDALAIGSAIKVAARGAHVAKILESGSDVSKAVSAFNKAQETTETAARSLDNLARDLEKMDSAAKAIKNAILKAARAEAEANEAWRIARMSYGGRAMSVIDPLTPLLDWAWHFSYPVMMSMRKGIRQLDQFIKTRYFNDLVGSFDDLTPAAKANVKAAHKAAVEEFEDIAKRVIDLGLDNAQFDEALALWGRRPNMKKDQFVKDILEPMAARGKSLDWPDRLVPSKPTGGKPGGSPATLKPGSSAEVAAEIALDKKSADVLADAGYDVVQNPGARPNGKKPDYTIEGEWADNLAPKPKTSPRNIHDGVLKKLGYSRSKAAIDPSRTQAQRIVLNLENWTGDLAALRKQFADFPLEPMGLKELLVVQGGRVFSL